MHFFAFFYSLLFLGKKNGRGILTVGRDRYEGEFVDNQMEGKGKYHYGNGCEYDGSFMHGDRHGKGKYRWSSGIYYQG